MGSCIPLAMPQLLSIVESVLPQDASIWVGRPLGVFSAPITFQIITVTADQEPAALGPDYKREETFEVHCILTSFAGDDDHNARLQEVYEQFNAVEVAIGNNPTLNDTVRFAETCGFTYIPDTDPSGKSIGSLAFEIRCSQRIDSLK